MGKDLKGKSLGKGLSQRKDGRYEARAVINGIKIDIYDMVLSNLKKSFEEEKAKLLRCEKNIRHNTTLNEWFEEWFETSKSPTLKSEVSRKVYKRKCKNTYIDILGEKLVSDISQINIQNATNELIEKGYKDKSVKEALGVLRECLDVAVLNNIIRVNPCVSINVKSDNTQQKRRVLTHYEQRVFLNEVQGSYYEIPYKILLLTGMRIGEFTGLQWDDVDWDNKQIRINRSMTTAYIDGKKIEMLTTPKTNNSYRIIPFFNETEKLLKEWKNKQLQVKEKVGENRWRCKDEYGDLVFTSSLGSPITRYVLQHDIKKVEQNINMKETYLALRDGRRPVKFEHIHPHAFRHTFATRCFEKGLDPVFVQGIMGHSNYSTTLSYTHVLEEQKRIEMNKVDGDFLN